MNDSLKSQINASGLKKKFIAKQVGVHPVVLSLCIKGERFLDNDQEQKLKDLLKKVS